MTLRAILVTGAAACAVLLAVAASALAAPGDLTWHKDWTPPGSSGPRIALLARGPGGDLWVAGDCSKTGGDSDLFLARYSPTGKRRWAKVYDTATHESQFLSHFAVDGNGNAVLAGYINVKNGPAKWYVLRVNAKGAMTWSKRITTTNVQGDTASDVAFDAGGNAYVVGGIVRGGSATFTVVKYAPGGAMLWTRYRDAGIGHSGHASAVAVDASGRVYVTGYFSRSAGSDVETVRYSSAGHLDWHQEWGASDVSGKSDFGSDIAVSAAGVAVAGRSDGATDKQRGLILKYALGGGAPKYESVLAGWFTKDQLRWDVVAINAAGQIAVGGRTVDYSAVEHYAMLTVGGAFIAPRAYDVSGATASACAALALSSGGRLFGTGEWRSAPFWQTYTVSWYPDVFGWSTQYAGIGAFSAGYGVALSSDSVYVSGFSGGAVVLLRYQR